MGKNNLKNGVMKKVRIIWFSKKIAPALFLYTPFLIFVALRETAREFFVLKILDNFLSAVHGSGFSGGAKFVFSALVNTPILPALIIVSSLGLCGWILLRLMRNFRQVRLSRSAA